MTDDTDASTGFQVPVKYDIVGEIMNNITRSPTKKGQLYDAVFIRIKKAVNTKTGKAVLLGKNRPFMLATKDPRAMANWTISDMVLVRIDKTVFEQEGRAEDQKERVPMIWNWSLIKRKHVPVQSSLLEAFEEN